MNFLRRYNKNATIILITMLGMLYILNITSNFVYNILFLLLLTFSIFAFYVFEKETKTSFKLGIVVANYMYFYKLLLSDDFYVSLYILLFIFPILYTLQNEKSVLNASVTINVVLFIFTNFTVMLNRVEYEDFYEFLHTNFFLNIIIFCIIHLLFIHSFNSRYKKELLNEFVVNNSKKNIEDLKYLFGEKISHSKNSVESIYELKIFLQNQKQISSDLSRLYEQIKIENISIEKENELFTYFLEDNNDKIKFLSREMSKQENLLKELKENYYAETDLALEDMTKLENINFLNISTSETLNDVVNSVSNIQLAIEAIKTTSNQINLLSLNASIESSKLGETGKSFSIISKEIKHLQENISILITTINSEINSIQRSYNYSKDNFSIIIKDTEFLMNEHRNQNKTFFDNRELTSQLLENQMEIVSGMNRLAEKFSETVGIEQQNSLVKGKVGILLEESDLHFKRNEQQLSFLNKSLEKLNKNLQKNI